MRDMNYVLATVDIAFRNMDTEVFLMIFTTYTGANVVYTLPVWSHYWRKGKVTREASNTRR